MARLSSIARLLGLALCLAFAPGVLCAAGKEASDVRRILIVYESDSALFAATEISRGLYRRLNERAPTMIELYSEHLDIFRFPEPDHLRRLAESLTAKYGNVALDLVLVAGPGALQFMLEHRDEIAPGKPLIAGGVSDRSFDETAVGRDVFGVVSRFDVNKTVELAARLQPDAKRVVVLTGSSDFDRRWQESAREDLGARYNGLDVEHLAGLSLEGFKTAARKLPSDTILLILTVFEDAEGRKFVPRAVAADIAAVAGAPSYSVYSSYVGTGIVGGFMETFEGIGEDMAALADQVLSGTAPASRFITSTGRPVIDWRQLRRWDLDAALLPADTWLDYYEPSAWERYRLQIVAVLAVIVLQSGTIAGLILSDRRRRKIKAELLLERLELAHLSRAAQLGALSGSFAHELNQPLTSILANAEAGAQLLAKNPVDLGEIKEILEDIVADDKRAAAVIAQLRQLMLKGEVKVDYLDLNEAVKATISLAHSELLARQTKIDLRSEQTVLLVMGNLAQLQQVILNLVLNAAEALSHLPASERRIEIETRRRVDGACELAVSDRGHGIAPAMREDAFKPFVSTKAHGLGLGLAICRSIALAHGGTLQFDEQRVEGARIVLTLPPISA